MLYQPPLPPNEAPSGDTPLLGCLRSGYTLPSSPQQRRILILIGFFRIFDAGAGFTDGSNTFIESESQSTP